MPRARVLQHGPESSYMRRACRRLDGSAGDGVLCAGSRRCDAEVKGMSEAAKAVSDPRSGKATENPFDPALFRPEAISAEQRAANEAFRKAVTGGPDWWDMGAAAYRALVA